MAISVWIRDRPQRAFLGPLPHEIELNLIPRKGPLPRGVRDAEFLVPPYDARPVLELLRQMPTLRVVQAISAGVEGLLPWVPDGVFAWERGRTEALTAHLAAGRVRAALDVTDPEPLPPEHPLWDMEGVLITPHVAGDSPAAEERVYGLVGEQLRRYAEGKPLLNVVVPTPPG